MKRGLKGQTEGIVTLESACSVSAFGEMSEIHGPESICSSVNIASDTEELGMVLCLRHSIGHEKGVVVRIVYVSSVEVIGDLLMAGMVDQIAICIELHGEEGLEGFLVEDSIWSLGSMVCHQSVDERICFGLHDDPSEWTNEEVGITRNAMLEAI